MTHTLHRKGVVKDLKEDYVILAMLAAGINDNYDDSRQRLIRVGEIMQGYNPVNMMSEVGWKTSATITAAYDDIESVKNVVYQLKREDLGISIVISGLISEIKDILKEVGLDIHTVHFSLNTKNFGKRELLPPERILEITTMCGHHTISPQSITHYINLIKRGKITIEKAASKLTRPCVCGIVNTSRIIEILTYLIKE
ncbi:MAG: hypothetical protein ACW98D_10300 [Promethearchaeota archaeon]|jgi:soluble P-type ATPase